MRSSKIHDHAKQPRAVDFFSDVAQCGCRAGLHCSIRNPAGDGVFIVDCDSSASDAAACIHAAAVCFHADHGTLVCDVAGSICWRASDREVCSFSNGTARANFINDSRRVKLTFKLLLVVAAIGSVTSLVQFVLKERRFLETHAVEYDPMVLNRVKGFMGHWMTFSGGQLLVWCAVLPIIVLIGRRWIIPLSIIGIAIVFSFTRGAWLGAGSGIAVASFWTPRKHLIRILVPILVVGVLASPFIYHRVSMSVKGESGGDIGRIKLLKVGVEMVRAHPLFGVGLERIPVEFPKYYKGNDLNTFYIGHMQNDFMQIAAERGLICFAAFLWFLLVLYRSLWRFVKSNDETLRLTAVSAMCALTGFLVMGLAEFNFGDSEPLILFLFIVSIPFGMDSVLKRPIPRVP